MPFTHTLAYTHAQTHIQTNAHGVGGEREREKREFIFCNVKTNETGNQISLFIYQNGRNHNEVNVFFMMDTSILPP